MGIPQRGINGQGFNWFPALCLGFLVHGNGVHDLSLSVCPKNESQGKESQGRTDDDDFVLVVHHCVPINLPVRPLVNGCFKMALGVNSGGNKMAAWKG